METLTRRYCSDGHLFQTQPTFEPCCPKAQQAPADRTHCPKGHEYGEKNTAYYRGSRYCKKCRRLRNQARIRRRKAQWARTRDLVRLRDRGLCRYCGGEGNEVDHVIPRCNRGTDDAFGNLVWACHRCNGVKGSMLGFTLQGERLCWQDRLVAPHHLYGAELLSLLQDS